MASVIVHCLLQEDVAPNVQIIVLEAGPQVISDHSRNLCPPLPAAALDKYCYQPSVAKSDFEVAGLIRALGGRSLLWNAWCPTPTASELALWPKDVVSSLENGYLDAASALLGVNGSSATSRLHTELRNRTYDVLHDLASPYLKVPRVVETLDAPIAQHQTTRRFYNAASALLTCYGKESERSQQRSSWNRLKLICNCRVDRLVGCNGTVSGIATNHGTLTVPADAKVILALGTIESTRLALQLFPNHPEIGKNLIGHFVSDVLCTLPRAALAKLDDSLEWSAQLLKGHFRSQHFQLQVVGASGGDGSPGAHDKLCREMPGIGGEGLFNTLEGNEARVSVIGIGELASSSSKGSKNSAQLPKNDPGESLKVETVVCPTDGDYKLWNVMDDSIDSLTRKLTAGTNALYRSSYGAGTHWQATPPSREFAPKGRRLRLIVHEGGTLRMGENPETSVTDGFGRFHACKNLYATGPALFPTVGSHNGSLTGAALAIRLADRIATELQCGKSSLVS